MPELDTYEIGPILSHGLGGIVFSGFYTATHRPVVLEKLPPELGTNTAFIENLARSGHLASQFHHPHILDTFDLIRNGDTYYLVTAPPPEPVLSFIASPHALLPLNDVLFILDTLLGVLDTIHTKGLPHGNISADSIFIMPDGDITLGNLALANALARTPSVPKNYKPMYPPPHSDEGGTVNGDLWAVVSLACDLLIGTPTLTRSASLPTSIRAILLHALNQEQNQRYQTAQDFKSELVAAADNSGATWRETTDLLRRAQDLSALPIASTIVASTPVFTPETVAAAPPSLPKSNQQLAPLPSPQKRRKHRKTIIGISTVIVLAIIASVLITTGELGALLNRGALTLTSPITLTATPTQGSCNTTFTFVATGTVQGTGQLVYKWQEGNSYTTQPLTVTITPQEGSFRFTEEWHIEGKQSLTSTMAIHIVDPAATTSSTTIHYTCH